MSGNGPDCASHLTTKYQDTAKAKSAQTPTDTGKGKPLKFADAHQRDQFGNSIGGAKRPESGGSGYRAGGRSGSALAGRPSDLAARVKG